MPHAKNTIVTPYQWLGYIRKAESVICGSFHATVFSLIFHKPFIVLLPKALEKKGGNTRINSLLEPLGLQGRILYDCRANDIEAAIRQAIDWDRVEAALTAQKQQSISFLKKALG